MRQAAVVTSRSRSRGRRNWEGKAGRAEAGVRQPAADPGRRAANELQRKRSELTERSMAHMYETGGMRRVHLKGRDNILKRLLVHAGGFNLALIMRQVGGNRQAPAVAGGFRVHFRAARLAPSPCLVRASAASFQLGHHQAGASSNLLTRGDVT